MDLVDAIHITRFQQDFFGTHAHTAVLKESGCRNINEPLTEQFKFVLWQLFDMLIGEREVNNAFCKLLFASAPGVDQ